MLNYLHKRTERTILQMKSDIKIAQSAKMKRILAVAESAGIEKNYIEPYGNYKAKVKMSLLPEGVREGSCLTEENGAFRLDEASAEALRRKHYMLQQRMKRKKRNIIKSDQKNEKI